MVLTVSVLIRCVHNGLYSYTDLHRPSAFIKMSPTWKVVVTTTQLIPRHQIHLKDVDSTLEEGTPLHFVMLVVQYSREILTHTKR
jgi:hypothetical protein